jgi:outer membrane protein assembly factor BamB
MNNKVRFTTLAGMRTRFLPALAIAVALACGSDSPPAPRPQLNCSAGTDWTQTGRTPDHAGTVCASGVPLTGTSIAVLDPNLPQETAEARGALLVHYQVPLVVGDDVYVSVKSPGYPSCNPPASRNPFPCGPDAWDQQIWNEQHFVWQGTKLVADWIRPTDWKPPPNRGTAPATASIQGWEPQFHAVVLGNSLWMPAASGGVTQLDRTTGQVRATILPFHTDPTVFVAGPLTATASGDILYTAIQLNLDDPWGDNDPPAFLVRIRNGAATVVPWATLVPGAPNPLNITCEGTYANPNNQPLPPLDSSGAVVPAPKVRCGIQRPAINAAPAVGPDGTIFLASRSHLVARYAYVVAVNPADLTPRWAASMRDILADGCGVTIAADGQAGNCTSNAPRGVDPATGTSPAGFISDQGSSSPVALPDGGVIFGALTNYNGFRGHLFKFASDGKVAGTFDFGWDITPAWFPHDGTYSIVLKDNHYVTGGPFYITQLDANLHVEWRFQSTNNQTCARQANGQVSCFDDGQHGNGFEWCINSVAVDKDGVIYANSEDGNLYAIGPGGVLKSHAFLDRALGAAYTPISVDAKGRIYAQNAGKIYAFSGAP